MVYAIYFVALDGSYQSITAMLTTKLQKDREAQQIIMCKFNQILLCHKPQLTLQHFLRNSHNMVHLSCLKDLIEIHKLN